MSKFPPDNIVLEEEIDVNYEPTEEGVNFLWHFLQLGQTTRGNQAVLKQFHRSCTWEFLCSHEMAFNA